MLRPTTALALVLATFTFGDAAHAAEWIRTTSAPTAEPAALVASRFVAGEGRAALRLGETKLERSSTLPLRGRTTVRFQQRHEGVEVDGKGAALLVAADGRVRGAMVDVARGLQVAIDPALSPSDALIAAKAALPFAVGKAVRSELVVVPRKQGLLAWRLDVRDARGGGRVLVDAVNGDLVGYRTTRSHALGRVYATSSVVDDFETTDVTLDTLAEAADPVRLSGWGGNLEVANYVSGGQGSGYEIEQTLGPSAGTDFLYDPPVDPEDATDAFAQVNLFHHLTTHRNFFRDVLEVDVDQPSYKLTAVANLQENGQPLDNAFFSPQGIEAQGALDAPNLVGIGQGTVDFAYDSDVFKHEFGHYVSHNAVGYNLGQIGITEFGFSPHSGSVDEGIADYFACSENDDPILGEATLAVLGAARDLEDTSKSCPGDMVGEVHFDGEIVASASWTLRQTLGRAVADRLVWGAVSLMPVGGTLGDFASGVLASADELVEAGDLTAEDRTVIEGILADRGLDDCGSVIGLDGEEASRTTLLGLDVAGQAFGASCADLVAFGFEAQSIFHFSGTAAGESATFHVDLEPLGGGDVDYRLLVRKDAPVTFGNGGVALPPPAEWDYEVGSTEGTLDLVIDASSDPPFDPASTYYAVILSKNCPTAAVDISFRTGGSNGEGGAGGSGAGGVDPAATAAVGSTSASTGTGPTGGTTTSAVGAGGGGDDVTAEGDGCGCEVAGADTGRGHLAGFGALGLAIAAFARRRRSR